MNITMIKRLAGLLAILIGAILYAWLTDDPLEVDVAGKILATITTAICLAVLYVGFAFFTLAWRAVNDDTADGAQTKRS